MKKLFIKLFKLFFDNSESYEEITKDNNVEKLRDQLEILLFTKERENTKIKERIEEKVEEIKDVIIHNDFLNLLREYTFKINSSNNYDFSLGFSDVLDETVLYNIGLSENTGITINQVKDYVYSIRIVPKYDYFDIKVYNNLKRDKTIFYYKHEGIFVDKTYDTEDFSLVDKVISEILSVFKEKRILEEMNKKFLLFVENENTK